MQLDLEKHGRVKFTWKELCAFAVLVVGGVTTINSELTGLKSEIAGLKADNVQIKTSLAKCEKRVGELDAELKSRAGTVLQPSVTLDTPRSGDPVKSNLLQMSRRGEDPHPRTTVHELADEYVRYNKGKQ